MTSGEISRKQLIEQMKDEKPVLLSGLVNAWCNSAILRKGTALINIIQTVDLPDNEQSRTDN